MTIDVVVVDLGGVAASFRPVRRLAALSVATGRSERFIQHALFASGLDRRAELGMIGPDEIISEVSAALRTHIDPHTLTSAWATAFEPDLEVLNIVRTVTARTVLFTNNGPMINRCLSGPLDVISSSFDVIICSWELKAVKPDEAAFESAALRLDAAPHQLLLLDDDSTNVESAQRCGWNAQRVSSAADVSEALADCARNG